MEGAPFHSFLKADAQPLPAGEAARVRFQLMPTAYRFAKVQLWDQDPLTAKESYANLLFEDLIDAGFVLKLQSLDAVWQFIWYSFGGTTRHLHPSSARKWAHVCNNDAAWSDQNASCQH
jgi:hypothetical protein